MSKTPEQEKAEVEAAFKKMESYNPTNKTIKPSFTKKMWDGPFGGVIPLDVFADKWVARGDDVEMMRILIHAMDRDKNGFVDSDEFHTITNTLFAHNPSFRKTDYGKFVVEADTNQDGKVSIEETVVWFSITKRLNPVPHCWATFNILPVQGGLLDLNDMNLISTPSFIHNHLAFQYYIFVTAAKHEIQEYFKKFEFLEMFGLKQVILIDIGYLLEDTLLLRMPKISKNVSKLNKYFWSSVTAFDILKHGLPTHVRPLYYFTPIIRLNNWGPTGNIFFLYDVQAYSFVSCHQIRSNSNIVKPLSSPLDEWSWALPATYFISVVLILTLLWKQVNSDGIFLMIGISLENSVLSSSDYQTKLKPTNSSLIGLNTIIGVWILLVGTILTNWYKSIFTMEIIVPTLYHSPWTTVMDVEGIRILMPFKLMGEYSVVSIKFEYFRHKYFYTQVLFRCQEIARERGEYKRLMVYKNRAKALVNLLRPHFGMNENGWIKNSGVFSDFLRIDEPHPFNKSILKDYPIQPVEYDKRDSYSVVKILSTCEKVALIDKTENIVKITNFLNDNQEKKRFVQGDNDHFFSAIRGWMIPPVRNNYVEERLKRSNPTSFFALERRLEYLL
ncbi:Parvalbumin beta [Folsomia candida]|uniref:Parvalbumin beta n=1 Tax=Folsomia candida TaxID=158441 RepID=A0A226D7E5_FOLCA|nr:Parvalbumin beta [Folsomia candida]